MYLFKIGLYDLQYCIRKSELFVYMLSAELKLLLEVILSVHNYISIFFFK